MVKLRLGSDKVIEEIKERVKRRNEHYVYESEHEVQYHHDILHLLSIIEQAERALKDISFITNYSDHITHKSAHNLSEAALKSIKGEGWIDMTLGEALPLEIERVQELIKDYESVPNGNFAAAMMRSDIKAARIAILNGDLAEMVRSHITLKEYE
jgi:hypothetical protein